MAKTKFYSDKELSYLVNQQLIGDCLDGDYQPDHLDCSLMNSSNSSFDGSEIDHLDFYRI